MSDMYYWERKAIGDDFLVLEPCDWTEEEWKVLLKLFGCVEAERMVVKDYILKVYGTPTESMRTIWDVNPGKDEILRDIMSDWERLTMKAKMFGLDISVDYREDYREADDEIMFAGQTGDGKATPMAIDIRTN